MSVAVLGSSLKENENRVSIHPLHVPTINPDVLNELVFEKGYGVPFGYSDDYFETYTGHPCQSRQDLLANHDHIILAKPTPDDIRQMPDHSILWGWVHAVQQTEIAQLGIEKQMTFVAWENMFYRNYRGTVHVFQTNNEMAGYCSVLDALQGQGIDGYFGAPKKIKVFSFGSVSRGAVHALISHGYHDIEVYSWRASHLVNDRIHSIVYSQIYFDEHHVLRIKKEGQPTLLDELTKADIIVNGILQNPTKPVMFFEADAISAFKKPCLIIDVSCDEGMAFPFAKATTFSEPTFDVGKIRYYGVDHSPSLLWNSASYQISQCLIPYLYQFTFDNYGEILENSIDLNQGRVKNEQILSFQHRTSTYPYQLQK